MALAATTEEAMSPIQGLTHTQHQQLLVLLGNHGASTGNQSGSKAKTREEWIVDSGATNLITHDLNSLSIKIVHIDLPPMQIQNGNLVKVHAWQVAF